MTGPDVLNYILYAGCAVILMVHCVVVTGIFAAFFKQNTIRKAASAVPDYQQESISIVIPARDEASRLPALFKALDSQDTQNFQVVFIDDRSTDGTHALLASYKAAHPDRVIIVRIEENPNTGNPKQYALARGSEAASGDILFLTDADCRFSRHWVSSIASVFAVKNLGLVFGPVTTEPGGGYLQSYQAFDHLFRYFYTAGAAGLGIPSGAFGNNMAVRASALRETGGFDSLPCSPTEDAALISAVRDKTDWKIFGFVSSETLVTTAPEKSWKSLSEQELRWNTGGLFAPDFMTRLNYRIVMLYLTVGVLVLPAALIHPPLMLTAASAALSMLMVALCAGIFGRGAVPKYFRLVVPNIIVSMLYYSLISVCTLGRKPIVWKGTVLDRGGTPDRHG